MRCSGRGEASLSGRLVVAVKAELTGPGDNTDRVTRAQVRLHALA